MVLYESLAMLSGEYLTDPRKKSKNSRIDVSRSHWRFIAVAIGFLALSGMLAYAAYNESQSVLYLGSGILFLFAILCLLRWLELV